MGPRVIDTPLFTVKDLLDLPLVYFRLGVVAYITFDLWGCVLYVSLQQVTGSAQMASTIPTGAPHVYYNKKIGSSSHVGTYMGKGNFCTGRMYIVQ